MQYKKQAEFLEDVVLKTQKRLEVIVKESDGEKRKDMTERLNTMLVLACITKRAEMLDFEDQPEKQVV